VCDTVEYMKKVRKGSTLHEAILEFTDGHKLSLAIIDTIHESLLVIDGELKVVTASRSFYKKFGLTPEQVVDKNVYDIAGGQCDIPKLRKLLEEIIPQKSIVEDYELEITLPIVGSRLLRIHARQVFVDPNNSNNPNNPNNPPSILLSLFDITEHKCLEHERENLLIQKDLLLKEMRHRIANSLQLIASILLLKADSVRSSASRAHLHDAHDRILSIATIQQQLEPGGLGEMINVAKYLQSLCKSLTRSMIGGRKPITIRVDADAGSVNSDTAIIFGLITTELVINSLKHAFVDDRAGTVTVSYTVDSDGWILAVSDDGVGDISKGKKRRRESTKKGTHVSIIHTTL
jgi:PAS domain S-box-containing protein